ncbi:MAG: flagellar FliJ family protein [Chloroflexi bacterium]|nr:flagellar FliJ family protein [Chloroflexota bacterium]
MPPKFSLQSVLDYRHSRVEALEVELGRLLAARLQAEARLEALRDDRRRLFDELRGQQAGTLNLGAIAQLRLNLKTVEGHVTRHETALADLVLQIERRRLELVVANQDEETLATLKNKELERHRAALGRHENRLRDDLYIARAYQQRQQP